MSSLTRILSCGLFRGEEFLGAVEEEREKIVVPFVGHVDLHVALVGGTVTGDENVAGMFVLKPFDEGFSGGKGNFIVYGSISSFQFLAP
ncbi:MAG: hypothetical protein KDK65_00225 [Chlamydiia bacterium]|nr:hypothetical protein [Chlamydiia bacterium]